MKSAYLSFVVLILFLVIFPQSTGFADVIGKENRTLEPGQNLPVLNIQGGEISVGDSGIVRKPWNSESLERKGKVQVVQYVAANRSAVRQSKPFARLIVLDSSGKVLFAKNGPLTEIEIENAIRLIENQFI